MDIVKLIVISLVLALFSPSASHPTPATALAPVSFALAYDQPFTKLTTVLVADQPWEAKSVQEPTVLYEGGLWRMWYTGNFWRSALGYAESYDGVHWVKPFNHPVLGNGYGGERSDVAHSSQMKQGDTYYSFYFSNPPQRGLQYATSPDGISWQARGQVLALASDEVALANTAVWTEGDTWWMLYEALRKNGAWQMSLARGSGPADWERLNAPILGLSPGGPGGTFGGAWLIHDGDYHLWFHASPSIGILPTDIYYSHSSDLLNWSPPELVLARDQPLPVDQVADASVITVDGRLYLYYDVVDNTHDWSEVALGRPPADQRSER